MCRVQYLQHKRLSTSPTTIGLYKNYEWFIMEDQLAQNLLRCAFSNSDVIDNRQHALDLLRAIIMQRLVIPQVYDGITQVQVMMVESQSQHIRQQAGSVLLQYLLNFPMQEKRRQRHIDFLVTNLNYQYDYGRLQVLSFIHAMIQKFPQQKVQELDSFLFLPLAARLVNDPCPLCREQSSKVISCLFQTISPQRREALVEFVLVWLRQQDERMRKIALQFFLMFTQDDGSKFVRKYVIPNNDQQSDVCQHLFSVVISTSNAVQNASLAFTEWNDQYNDFQEGILHNDWGECYLSLKVIDSVICTHFSQFDWVSTTINIQQFWRATLGLLIHHHVWVREVAAKLMKCLLISSKELWAVFQQLDATIINWYFVQGMCSRGTSEQMCESLVCGLLKVSEYLLQHNINAFAFNSEAGSQQMNLNEQIEYIVKLAEDRQEIMIMQRQFALKYLISLVVKFQNRITGYLDIIIRPFYRLSEGSGQDDQDLVLLSQEGLNQFREILGANTVYAAFTQAKDTVLNSRKMRKKKKQIEAVVNVEASALKKRRLNAKKKIAKARKIILSKEARENIIQCLKKKK
eukprot:TRINITY_DN7503_c0_g1_i1.p1 TRINITY_DN7503_c0_g1~~TRINITY_DN7503_c0_g1_i1.p1  ORF type:complete len:574 (+),score=16.90 TRINITY_DN7503_c0_g1_i1:150-1871(+)